MVLSQITKEEWAEIKKSKYKKDCCPCVLRLIGIPEDDASKMVEYFGTVADMTERDLLQYFSTKYTDFKFNINKFTFTDRESSIRLLGEIYNGLPHGYGGVCAFRRGPERNYTGHCVILYKDDVGEVFLLDAQAQAFYQGDTKIIKYFDDNNIIEINTIHSSHKVYGYTFLFWRGEKAKPMDTGEAKRKKTKRKKTKRKKSKHKKTKRKKTKRKKTKRIN